MDQQPSQPSFAEASEGKPVVPTVPVKRAGGLTALGFLILFVVAAGATYWIVGDKIQQWAAGDFKCVNGVWEKQSGAPWAKSPQLVCEKQVIPPPVVAGLTVTAPLINATVGSPLTITGSVSGNGWNGFEGQVGTVELRDANNTLIANTYLPATADWMQTTVPFSATLTYTQPATATGKLVFKNENASGEPSMDKTYILPVVFSNNITPAMTLKVFFSNDKMDPEISCNTVFAVERSVAKTQQVAAAALEALLKGPSVDELQQGYLTHLNGGVVVKSLKIENETAYVDFNDAIQYQVGGSCLVTAIRSQITETLKQFPTVKNVVISVEGNVEEALQP